jgi:hypothetical protein
LNGLLRILSCLPLFNTSFNEIRLSTQYQPYFPKSRACEQIERHQNINYFRNLFCKPVSGQGIGLRKDDGQNMDYANYGNKTHFFFKFTYLIPIWENIKTWLGAWEIVPPN